MSNVFEKLIKRKNKKNKDNKKNCQLKNVSEEKDKKK